ncbi:MAG: YbaB/EbfC family nucleoid-associated protein [Tepidiformaceae bacterium]
MDNTANSEPIGSQPDPAKPTGLPDLGALFGGSGEGSPFAAVTEMLASAQRNLASVTSEGVAGGGAVRVTLNGERRMTAITITPEVLESGDAEMLQDLILAAANEAFEKANASKNEAVGGLAGLFGAPGS